MSEPLIPEAIVGYRIFKVYIEKDSQPRIYQPKIEIGWEEEVANASAQDLFIGGLFVNSVWEPGLNKATCYGSHANFYGHLREDHSAPHSECNCGFQAYFNLGRPTLLSPAFFEEYLIASVIGGGRVEIHKSGWRAEKAMVTGLLWNREKVAREAQIIQRTISEKYGVPLFNDRKEFIENATEKGMSVSSGQKIPGIQIDKHMTITDKEGAMAETNGNGAIEEERIIKMFADPEEYEKISKMVSRTWPGYRDYTPEEDKIEEEAVRLIKKDLGKTRSAVYARLLKNNFGPILLSWLAGFLLVLACFSLLRIESLLLILVFMVFWISLFPLIFIQMFEISRALLKRRVLKPLRVNMFT